MKLFVILQKISAEGMELDYNKEENQVEREDEGIVQITTPFNPNMIRIRRDPFTISELVDKMEHGEIRFDTPFQRKSDLWDEVKQSRLIESLLLRLPLPAFYFDEAGSEDNADVWNVIDGLQRCSVFKNFIMDKTMRLQNLEFLSNDYDGYTFDGLPRTMQRRITQTSITMYLIENGTPEEVKFNIFKRINTGGLILTPQEIRHAMNQGIAAETVAAMALMPEFVKATCGIIKTDRMEDRDFVTRFVAFYLQDYKSYEPDMDGFMTRGMSRIKKISAEEREAMKMNFERAMKTANGIFGNDAFRKRQNEYDRRRPINKALFETLSVVFARRTEAELKTLLKRKDEVKKRFIELNNDVKFFYALSSGTGQKDSVNYRHRKIQEMIENLLVGKEQ